MPFKYLDKLFERLETARQDSDTAVFYDLLFVGEAITKLVVAGLVAAIADDSQRSRYRQLHRLVRADGLGEWTAVLDELLTGPSAQHIKPDALEETRELTQSCSPGEWQYDAVARVTSALTDYKDSYSQTRARPEPLPAKLAARRWFAGFVELRNATRGHGAPTGTACSVLCRDIEASLRLVADNYALFRRQWAYLHRNLSGKYRVTVLSEDGSLFAPLRSAATVALEDGVYVYLGSPQKVELVYSTVDAFDFFLPNGAFNGKRFETLSYVTDNRGESDAAPYMSPATELPPSETQGLGLLEVQGDGFGNLPPRPVHYIHRPDLETELQRALLNDRHPVVTLVGGGGIGKTSLALQVLHDVAEVGQYAAILWFSSRDIDLLPSGPKVVQARVLGEADVARDLVRLLHPKEAGEKGFKPLRYLGDSLNGSDLGALLFVFDNFETVRSPAELYVWLDTYIRLPNKILITTRFREFKADFPVEVQGMSRGECDELVTATASDLGISQLLTESYREELFRESDGHPYVIKVLLGDVAKAGRLVKVERLVATKDEILSALFERTFAGLSPAAKRVFLMLANWRATVPALAVEAVLLRPANEAMDVEAAIEELRRSSFVEILLSTGDREAFLSVPLAAALFGRRKLAASPMKTAVEADTLLLHTFGAGQDSDVKHGVGPRVSRMFREVAGRVARGETEWDEHLPMLEFVARKHPAAWLLLATFYREQGGLSDVENAKAALRRYLEMPGEAAALEDAWMNLASLCRETSDYYGEMHALVAMAELPQVTYSEISNAANRLNALLARRELVLDSDEKKILVRRFLEIMERRIKEADATDFSRLAWLSRHLQDDAKAQKFIRQGLEVDPANEYIRRLTTGIVYKESRPRR